MEEEAGLDCRRCGGCTDSLEERVVRHCAPTLAGIKCGSMFRMCMSPSEILGGLRFMNRLLQSCGVSFMALRTEADALLVYVYRPGMLSDVLSDTRVREFLGDFGYHGTSYVHFLRHLRVRFSESSMPHEVGIFLGYPLEDVKGFMANGGKSCACSGCWKSYGDAAEAECRFRRCRECTRKCMEMHSRGVSLADMAVSVFRSSVFFEHMI